MAAAAVFAEVGILARGRATKGYNRLDRGLYQDPAPVLRF